MSDSTPFKGQGSLNDSSARWGATAPPVLIVDDSPTMREILRTILELSGQPPGTIHEAGDGIDAIKCLRQNNIGILLVDLHMPRMDGLQLLEWVSQQEECRPIATAVISAENCKRYAKRLVGHGVRWTIRKPFLPEQVRDVYRSLVASYRLGVAP
jgi:CheY-like chemotaxis protein